MTNKPSKFLIMSKIANINSKSLDNLQNDNVFVDNKIVSFETLTGIPGRKGLENVVISNGKVVNAVSEKYGHLPNESFFLQVEEKLINADINYVMRSINRNDCSFAVDYILKDDRYNVCVKNSNDTIMPMLRFTNSYDGTSKTSGHFGFFRKVCENGLHVSQSDIAFKVKHRGNIAEIVLPEIDVLIEKFLDNEFYTLQRKFETLAENQISDVAAFVKKVCEDTKIFKFEASDTNPLPSLNAITVIDNIRNESEILGEAPNFWLGYNAMQEILHTKFKKTFDIQHSMDTKIFESVLEMAN
jgi:hypothetical protein